MMAHSFILHLLGIAILLAQPISAPAQGSPPWTTGPADTQLATYHIFHSQAVGANVSYHIYLPTAYKDQNEQSFPVLYYLHGSSTNTIGGIPWLASWFHNAMEGGLAPPFIIVFPNGLPFGMWCDSKDGNTPIESMVLHDLIPHIDATYRSIPARNGRLLEGFSMGGYGAARLGLKHHQLFRGYSMLGAGPLQLDFLEDNPDLVNIETRLLIFDRVYGNDMEYFEQQSPWRLAESKGPDLPADHLIRQVVGNEDSMLTNNRAFHDHLDDLGIPHTYLEIVGVGHQAPATLVGIGPSNWDFYQAAFSTTPTPPILDIWSLY